MNLEWGFYWMKLTFIFQIAEGICWKYPCVEQNTECKSFVICWNKEKVTSDSNAITFSAEGRFEEENKAAKCNAKRVKSL